MKFIKNKSGVSIIATVLALLMLSLFAAVVVSLITTGSGVSVQEVQGMQAFSIAEGGLERALGGFKWTGTACALLTYNNIPLGLGSFSTTGTLYNPSPSTTLTANIFIGTLTIPAVSTAGYAPYGRIRIDSEEIDYSYISGNNFIVAKRGANGTIEANHSFGASVIQNQCLIRSTGTITNPFGNIQRVVEKAVAIVPSAAFLDGGSVAIGTTETNIGSLSTTFPSGNNLIIVAVSLRKNTAPSRDIALGNLRLRRGGTTLASNQSLIRVGGGAAPSATNFPQETQFLLYRDVGVGPYPTYDVTAIASGAGISGEVKMIVINNAPSSSFQDGGNVGIVTVAAGTTILTHNSTVPAGNNVIIAAVQLDNTAGATRTISAGNLELRRGVTTLSENQFAVNLARSGRVNRGTGVLLIARDAGAPANPTYTVWGRATGGGGIMGEAKIIVLNGLLSAFLDTGSVAVGIAETTIGSLNTTFPAGENVIIAANQYDNNAFSQRNISVGNERIVVAGAPQSSNEFDINLCTTGTAECDDFASGLLWRQANGTANPTYSVRALASGAGINAETKIMTIHLYPRVPIVYSKEAY